MVFWRWIAWLAIISQVIFFVQMIRNYRYVLSKYKRRRGYYPKAVLVVPCKGIDSTFEKNISSFFNQDYQSYLLWFVVADKSDPAYDRLCWMKDKLAADSKALDIQIMVAGEGKECSQKNHNLLYCCRRVGGDIKVLAFADSDICVRRDWLAHIVYPLRKPKNGAASGYRWFVPERNNLATLALSAVNAKIAQLLGNTMFNQVWGGSMAVRTDTFREVGLDQIWAKSLSDDLSLSYAVKKAGMRVVFVPACLAASYDTTDWRGLFEFGRRQFLITRVSAPGTWFFGLFSAVYSILGLWGGLAMALYAAAHHPASLPLFVIVPAVFFLSQLFRVFMRQKMIGKLLAEDRCKMRLARLADMLFFWVWTFLMLFFIVSSAFGRTIVWRGIRYRLLGPTETVVVGE